MNTSEKTPYENLTPSLILDAVESVGYVCNGSLFSLNSFENRVYQIGIEAKTPVIAKFYRPNRWSDAAILEEHGFALELESREIPIVAPTIINNKTLHHYENYRFALFPRKGGRALELENEDTLEWMGRFIGRLHAVSCLTKFQHRMKLDVSTYGYQPYEFLMKNKFIPEYLQANFRNGVEAILKKVADRFKEVGAVDYIRLHGDCHAGNVLWNDTGPHFVDLDDCLMGPAIQDLWMLLSGDPDHMHIQLDKILQGYCDFHDYHPKEIYLIEALRTLRMLHYAAWLAKRWEDPAFPRNFPWFNTTNYWEGLLRDLNEQGELL